MFWLIVILAHNLAHASRTLCARQVGSTLSPPNNARPDGLGGDAASTPVVGSGGRKVDVMAPSPASPNAKGFDTNQDGKLDSWDTTGDGKIDAWDTTGDGLIDRRGAHVHPVAPSPNAKGFDTNHDGKLDSWDTTGDGKIDAWDTTGDGLIDTKPVISVGVKTRVRPTAPPPNVKGFDSTEDGKIDAWDTTGDGAVGVRPYKCFPNSS
jgi:hypothetical protein